MLMTSRVRRQDNLIVRDRRLLFEATHAAEKSWTLAPRDADILRTVSRHFVFLFGLEIRERFWPKGRTAVAMNCVIVKIKSVSLGCEKC